MRVLFYLPVVTPWWFEKIIVPLLEKLALDHEVHILGPMFWQGTGLGQNQYDLCAHMPGLRWHIVTDEGHRSMRESAEQRDQIIDFVRSLEPDFALCRSADLETTAGFPGTVRHITEGGADPLLLPVGAVHLARAPFDHGVLPPLDERQRAQLEALIEPHWDGLGRTHDNDAFREWAQLPTGRPTLFMPLEYEHAENYYLQHRVGSRLNAKLVEDMVAKIDGRAFLALTNHPLNDLYVNNDALKRVVEANPEAVRLLPGEMPDGRRSTPALMNAADGVLLGDSKCYSLAAYTGTPILRRSHFQTGEWLGASKDLDKFVGAICQGGATAPCKTLAKIWFAYHVANSLISPRSATLTGSDILERMRKPFDPEHWEDNFRTFSMAWDDFAEVAA